MAPSLNKQGGVASTTGTLAATWASGGTAAVHDLLVAFLRADTPQANVTTVPAGWVLIPAASDDDNLGAGCIQTYWKADADGTETGGTWGLASAVRGDVEIFAFSGGTNWTVDKAATNDPVGTAFASVPAYAAGDSGTLAAAVEVALMGASQYTNSNGGSESVDGFTAVDNTTSRLVAGYLITSTNAALNPTARWASSKGTNAAFVTFYQATVARGLGGTAGLAPPSVGAFAAASSY